MGGRGYSTIDNAFILNSFVQKYLGKRRKVYVAFIDYRKAFASVNRSVLWKILCKNSIIGKMLVIQVFMRTYAVMFAVIRVKQIFSNF